jgi:cell division cycle 20-like protein 1 (cofactor of APC complex)
MPAKKTVFYSDNLGNRPRAAEGSEPVDASALAKALKDYGEAGTRRERTPGTSPHRKRQRVYGDR